MTTDISNTHCGYCREKPQSWDDDKFVDDEEWTEDGNDVICHRGTWRDQSRCIWHAETEKKDVDELAAAKRDGPERLSEAYLVGVEFKDRISFVDCLLDSATLSGTELSGANLIATDFTDANLSMANLSGADLGDANLSGADLGGADLSEAVFLDADLSGAILLGANLSGAELQNADLTDTNLIEANLSDVALNRLTRIELRLSDVKQDAYEFYQSEGYKTPQVWDAVARVAHELKTASSANGLVGRAREYRLQERRARRREAKAEGGVAGWTAWGGSVLSRIFTGYGVQLRSIVLLMIILWIGSAAWYWWVGVENSLYYSTITFTTASPPNNPPQGAKLISTIETFFGTLFIVLLGYILGNREQV